VSLTEECLRSLLNAEISQEKYVIIFNIVSYVLGRASTPTAVKIFSRENICDSA